MNLNQKILRYYLCSNGKAPLIEWLEKMRDGVVRTRIKRRLERVEAGHYGDYSSLGDGVYELRFFFGSGYRIYFAEQDHVVVLLLCGGDKSTQSQDIETAKHYWAEFKRQCL